MSSHNDIIQEYLYPLGVEIGRLGDGSSYPDVLKRYIENKKKYIELREKYIPKELEDSIECKEYKEIHERYSNIQKQIYDDILNKMKKELQQLQEETHYELVEALNLLKFHFDETVRNMITCKYSGNLDADRKVITHCCKLHKVDDDYDFEIVQNINEELDEQINLNKEYSPVPDLTDKKAIELNIGPSDSVEQHVKTIQKPLASVQFASTTAIATKNTQNAMHKMANSSSVLKPGFRLSSPFRFYCHPKCCCGKKSSG